MSMVLFWALITASSVALVRYVGQAGGREQRPTSAEEIPSERYAREEIDDEEYRRRLQALSERGHWKT
ncbi:SHOCT domain-containing protein [Saccharopolyspora kobensis]|uniref:SHOCT domain-containing protein n=1 Tax=Saccharopolyspora kobensis TaxID=146035 RepID=UPI001C638C4C